MTRKEALKITKDLGLTGGAQNIGIAILMGDTTTTGGAWDNVRKLLNNNGQSVPTPTPSSTTPTTPTTPKTTPAPSKLSPQEQANKNAEQTNLAFAASAVSKYGSDAIDAFNKLPTYEEKMKWWNSASLGLSENDFFSKYNITKTPEPTPEPKVETTTPEPTPSGEFYDSNGQKYTGNTFVNSTTGKTTDAQGNELFTTPPGTAVDPETGETVDYQEVPDSIKNSEYFQALSPAKQAEIQQYYNFMITENEQTQQAFLDTIEEAKTYADPKFKEEMRLVADAVGNNLVEMTGDYTANAERLKKNLDEIQQDIKDGGEQFTIEEQNALRQQAENYSNQLDSLASRGLISSTFREKADTEKRGIYESTTRSMARTRQSVDRQMRDYARQLETQYGTIGAQNILAGRDPVTGEAIEGGQNLQTLGAGNFLLGTGDAEDVVGLEKERRAESVYSYAGALSPLNKTLNPLTKNNGELV